MNRKIGVIGSGAVGQVLANGFVKHGYDVMIGTNNASKYAELKEKTNGKAAIGTFETTSKFADIVALATKGGAAEDDEILTVEFSRGATATQAKRTLDASVTLSPHRCELSHLFARFRHIDGGTMIATH